MENIETVKLYTQALDTAADALMEEVKAFSAQTLNERSADITALERAQLTNNYAYTLSSLFFAFLKASGEDTAKHGIMDELARVKSYMATVKRAETGGEEVGSNAALAKRYLKASLGQGNSTVVTGAQTPAISAVHFTGTHTKFAAESQPASLSSDDAKAVASAVKKSAGKPKSASKPKAASKLKKGGKVGK